jgi:hypothetical protein
LETKGLKTFAIIDLDRLRLDVVSAFSPVDFDRPRFFISFPSISVAVLF